MMRSIDCAGTTASTGDIYALNDEPAEWNEFEIQSGEKTSDSQSGSNLVEEN